MIGYRRGRERSPMAIRQPFSAEEGFDGIIDLG